MMGELKVHCLLGGLFAASTAVSALASQPPRAFAAPGIDPAVLELALRAAEAARAALVVAKPEILTVIDYSLPSTEPRFWVLHRTTGAVLWHELVAHGVIDRIRGGSLVFIYYPNESWLRHSRFLGAAAVLTGKDGSGLPVAVAGPLR